MVSEQKKMKEELHVATYKYVIPSSEMVIREVDLEKRKPQAIMLEIGDKLNTLFMRTDSMTEEIIRSILGGKLKPERLRTSIDKQGNFILSMWVAQGKEEFQVSIMVYKNGDIVATLSQGEKKDLMEILTVKKHEVTKWPKD